MNIQKYDKLLSIKKNIDGSKLIQRKSPFYKGKKYDILKIKNKIVGNWIFRELFNQDCQRRDIVGEIKEHNSKLHYKDNSAMHKDIANFIQKNEQIII